MQCSFWLFSLAHLLSLGILSKQKSSYLIHVDFNRYLPILELVNAEDVGSFVTINNEQSYLTELLFINSTTETKSSKKSKKLSSKNSNISRNRKSIGNRKKTEGFFGSKTSIENGPGQEEVRGRSIETDIRKISDPKNFKLTGAVKVRGGNDAPVGFFPWQVSIMYGNDTQQQHICGGSLFSTDPLATTFDTILTAAHCVFQREKVPLDTSLFTVLGGTVFLDSINDKGGKHQTSKVCGVFPYKSYSGDNHYLDDIAVLKLSTPFRKCSDVDAIQIETSLSAEDISGIAYISGWGTISGGNASNRLQAAKVPLIDDRMCRQYLDNLEDPLRFDGRTQICAGGLGEIDVCKGDSGGPLVCKNKDDEFGFQCGIVSFGSPCTASEEFRKTFPGVYTMPQGYIHWIKEKESLPRCI